MNIAQSQENNTEVSYAPYMGIENFHVVAINPTMAELNDMGIPATEEPTYVSKFERNGVEYDGITLRIFLDNKNTDNPIRTSVNINVLKRIRESSTGKVEVINKYGATAWFTEDAITDPGKIPSNMEWYVAEGVRKAYQGEPLLVDFIKALRNLPAINQNSTPDAKEKGVAAFESKDFDKMFSGDFSDIRKILLDENGICTVGFLLGVRKVEDKYRQSLFSRMPLKSYIKHSNNHQYLIKEVNEAQDNGSFSDVIFDLTNFDLRQHHPEAEVITPDNDDDLPF